MAKAKVRATPKKKHVGASKAANSIEGNRRIRRALKIVLVVSSLVFAAMYIDVGAQLNKVKALTERPITKISIEGEFKYLSQEKVRGVLEGYVVNNFLDLDLHEIKNAMELNPWIESVVINRVWPDKLVVKIDEQAPIARWGDAGFINRFGSKIEVPNNEILKSLPKLTGPDSMVKPIASRYAEMAMVLRDKKIPLVGITVDETKSWILWFDGEKSLHVGTNNILEKLELFLFVYDRYLDGSLNKVKKIDMRYESGLAVEWVEKVPALAGVLSANQKKYARN